MLREILICNHEIVNRNSNYSCTYTVSIIGRLGRY